MWSNARAGLEEMWRVALVMASLTGGYALIEWHVPIRTFLFPEPAGECWAGTDSRCFPLAVLIAGALITVLGTLRVPRVLQVLLGAAAGLLVLLSRYGLYMPVEVPGAA